MTEPKTKTRTIRAPVPLLDWFETIAQEAGRNANALIVEAMVIYRKRGRVQPKPVKLKPARRQAKATPAPPKPTNGHAEPPKPSARWSLPGVQFGPTPLKPGARLEKQTRTSHKAVTHDAQKRAHKL